MTDKQDRIYTNNDSIDINTIKPEGDTLRPITYLGKLKAILFLRFTTISSFSTATKLSKFINAAKKPLPLIKNLSKPMKVLKSAKFINSLKNLKNLKAIKAPLFKFIKIFKRSRNTISSTQEIKDYVNKVSIDRITKVLTFISNTYQIYDIIHRGYLARQKGYGYESCLLISFDTALWHMLASRILPGWTIGLVLQGSRKLFTLVLPGRFIVYTPYISAIVTLCSIPIFIKPIDQMADFILNNTCRRLYSNTINK
jgi:hypothetical protein